MLIRVTEIASDSGVACLMHALMAISHIVFAHISVSL